MKASTNNQNNDFQLAMKKEDLEVMIEEQNKTAGMPGIINQ